MNIYAFVILILSIFIVFLFFYLLYFTKKFKVNNTENKSIKRVCPLCGSKLGQNDCVIGEYIVVDGKKKVYIYGCNYCLKGNIHGKRISL